MKIILKVELKEAVINRDYRPIIVSFIKTALFKYNSSLFEDLYGKGKTTQKSFTFDVLFHKPKFDKDTIHLQSNEFQLAISTYDPLFSIELYNALLSLKFIEFPLKDQNHMRLLNVRIFNHTLIDKEEVCIQMYSPIVVREHSRDENDRYYFFDEEDFDNVLLKNLKAQLENSGKQGLMNEFVSFTPICPKRVVVKSFGSSLPASIGIFQLKGSAELINYLYQAGIGSRRSQGFGMFEIITK